MKPIIKVENLSKQYRLGSIGTGTIKNDLKRWWYNLQGKEDPFLKIGETNDRATKGDSQYAWALKDINFEVMPGEVLGIIGKNGAGKSTLLKILSKVTGPTTGRIDYNGRIGSLLEVGTGFHPELTGRENIFLNGAILGMTKYEIRSKLDEIIDFSGCERYIDTPVKRYSSGMTVRLGFAVAAHLEPEILVVDEVLAVGDAEFQKKAIGKMQEVSRNEGRTVLFVSHNMAAVEKLCKTGIVLENGSISYAGVIQESILKYLNNNIFYKQRIIDGVKKKHKNLLLYKITINNSDDNLVNISPDENAFRISIQGNLKIAMKIAIEIRFYDDHEKVVAFYSPSQLNGVSNKYPRGNFEINESFNLPENLTSGEYFIDIDLIDPNIEGYITIPKHVKLISSGVMGHTGIEFKYAQCGLIVLK